MSEWFPTLMRERRLELVRALESGDYMQSDGSLCTIDNGEMTNCCLGVARDRIRPGYFQWKLGEVDEWDFQQSDDSEDYATVKDHYGINDNLEQRLIAFNDGDACLFNGKPVSRREWRDFKFIARFLRKVWGLTDAE